MPQAAARSLRNGHFPRYWREKRPLRPISAKARAAASETAPRTASLGSAPVAKSAPSMPRTTSRAGEAAEGAAELDRLGEAERVGRGAGEGGGERRGGGVEPVDGAGRGAGGDGVGEDDALGTVPGFEQADRLAAELQHLDSGRAVGRAAQPPPRLARHQQPRRVVAAQLVAEADQQPPAAAHSRSTSSRRKWVEQEMQGS